MGVGCLALQLRVLANFIQTSCERELFSKIGLHGTFCQNRGSSYAET